MPDPSYGLARHEPHNRLAGLTDVSTIFDRSLADHPERLAIVGSDARLSYGELESRVNAAAAALQHLGVGPGIRVAASLPNGCNIVELFLAVQRLGAIWVGVNRNLAREEKLWMLEDSGAILLVTDPAGAAAVTGLASRVVASDPGGNGEWQQLQAAHRQAGRSAIAVDRFAPAAIAYTSGTTGRPKGAVHSQHNMVVAAAMSELMSADRRHGVVRGISSPLTILNMMILGPLATLSHGRRFVAMDRTDALGIAEWVRAEGVNTTTLVPTIVYDLLTRPDIDAADLASLTWIVVGGAMVPEQLDELYRARFGTAMTTGYGQTEAPTAITRTDAGSPKRQGAVGRALPHLEVQILDDNDEPVEGGTLGEVCVRAAREGPFAGIWSPTLGYWNQPAATAALLRNGWLHTGDVGTLDAQGQLYIQDRRSDVILRGGANIYPAEVERVLRTHPAVRDCAVLGLPDERLGQIVAAAIETDAQEVTLIEELRDICESRLARYKTPVLWHFEPSLPRNPGGKLLKKKIKGMFP